MFGSFSVIIKLSVILSYKQISQVSDLIRQLKIASFVSDQFSAIIQSRPSTSEEVSRALRDTNSQT